MLQNCVQCVIMVNNMAQCDEHILTRVFTRLRTRLLGVAQGVVGNDDDAADVLQDAFVRLWLHRDELTDDNQAARMTMAAVRNASIDRVRRRQAKHLVPMDDQQVGNITDEPDDLRQHVYDEVNDIVQNELTSTQRAIIEMRELQGMDYDEIAHHLGMRPTAVRVQLSRARKRVRDTYRTNHNRHET